jgi:hypothetical protein
MIYAIAKTTTAVDISLLMKFWISICKSMVPELLIQGQRMFTSTSPLVLFL